MQVFDRAGQRFLHAKFLGADLAIGTLIGNADMHGGKLWFISGQAGPDGLAAAYDMPPVAFLARLQAEPGFSCRFGLCVAAR